MIFSKTFLSIHEEHVGALKRFCVLNMGNSTSKDPNKERVRLGLQNYALSFLPEKPSKFKDKMAWDVWNEFKTLCRTSTQLEDVEDRKKSEKRATCCQFSGMGILLLGLAVGGGMGGAGGGIGNQPLMITGIVLGALLFIGGIIMGQGGASYVGHLKQKYRTDVRRKLNELLIPINDKYKGQITYTTRAGNGLPTGVIMNVFIDIEIHVDYVKYVDKKHVLQQVTMRPQMPTMQQGQVGQVIMIQMPDGSMVPAQIMGQVANVSQVTAQHGMEMQQHLHQTQSYNPNGNKIEEEQREGEGATNGESVPIYQ
eukprot:364404_1